jgi:hypothetical protein
VEHFWLGIGTVLKANLRVTDAYYLESDALTRKWAFEHPSSVMAQLLYAASLKAHAWSQRGEGYADTVSPMAWTGFHKYLDLAEGQLRRNEAVAAHDGSWNYLMLEIGRGQGWDNVDLLAVYQAGIAKNPDFDGLDFAMLTALLPRWGGDIATSERFIAQVTKRTREKRGMEMYARLYASLSYGEVQQALFTGTHVSWPVMKSGFEEWVRRYPHVDNRNEYAYFACMAQDRGALREQLDLIGDQFVAEFWGGNAERTFEACRGFARRE